MAERYFSQLNRNFLAKNSGDIRGNECVVEARANGVRPRKAAASGLRCGCCRDPGEVLDPLQTVDLCGFNSLRQRIRCPLRRALPRVHCQTELYIVAHLTLSLNRSPSLSLSLSPIQGPAGV